MISQSFEIILGGNMGKHIQVHCRRNKNLASGRQISRQQKVVSNALAILPMLLAVAGAIT